MNKVTLFGKGAHGTNVWEIWSIDNIIHIHANGGAYTEVIKEGKGGRTLKQQVQLRMEARIRGKLDGGFKRTKEELTGEITNQLGLVAPMLATPSKGRVIPFGKGGVYAQPKLDGHRCLMNINEAYSRRGKLIETIPEIQRAVNVPNGLTLDGELYCHGQPLQTIASWAKRRQKDTIKLQYHIYDVIGLDCGYAERLDFINRLVYNSDFVRIVPTVVVSNMQQVENHFAEARQAGYEGSILRVPSFKYGIGIRSKGLLKVKSRHSAEFKCVDVLPTREGLGNILLETEEGLTFKTPAPGCNFTKRKTLEEKEKYIGKWVTCEYAERTKDNIPFHCVAMNWRNDL